MTVSQMTYAEMKEDELERLALVHEDARDFLREKKRREKKRLYLLLVLLLVTCVISYYECSGKTRFFGSFIQEFWVVPEQKPHDGNAVPMHFGGKTPLFVPDLNSAALINQSSLVQPASYAAAEIQEKKAGASDSSSGV